MAISHKIRQLMVIKALVEWRDARRAIFAASPVEPKQWCRLADAEHQLMKIAETIATATGTNE